MLWPHCRFLAPTIIILLEIMRSHALVSSSWTAEWIDLQAPSIHPPRSGHVAFVNDDSVYVFGGYAEEAAAAEKEMPNRYPTNDFWKFETNQWKLVDEKDAPLLPQQRLASAAASLPKLGRSFVFGGWDSQEAGTGGVILKDICVYEGGVWKVLDDVDLELPTSRLVAVAISDDTILLHNHRSTDHVLLFSCTKDGHYKLTKQPTTGNAPSPRGLHVASCIGKEKDGKHLIVFGGAAQDGTMSNEVFALNLSTFEWNEVDVSAQDDMPSPRASPCFCTVSEDSLVMFGGAERSDTGLHGCDDLWLLQVNLGASPSATWEQLEPINKGPSPPGRNAATLTELASPPISSFARTSPDLYFLLSGGWYPFRTTHGDTFVLKMTRKE